MSLEKIGGILGSLAALVGGVQALLGALGSRRRRRLRILAVVGDLGDAGEIFREFEEAGFLRPHCVSSLDWGESILGVGWDAVVLWRGVEVQGGIRGAIPCETIWGFVREIRGRGLIW